MKYFLEAFNKWCPEGSEEPLSCKGLEHWVNNFVPWHKKSSPTFLPGTDTNNTFHPCFTWSLLKVQASPWNQIWTSASQPPKIFFYSQLTFPYFKFHLGHCHDLTETRCFFFLSLFYYCSSTVVCIFSPPLLPTLAIPTSLPWSHSPLVLSMCPL